MKKNSCFWWYINISKLIDVLGLRLLIAINLAGVANGYVQSPFCQSRHFY
jgi:hypothetical protein